jgi:hypothetical protein
MTLAKPIPHKRELLDYNEAVGWINKKYATNIDDYSQTFWGKCDKDAEFQCFWHLFCDEVSNGSTYFLDLEHRHGNWPDWAIEILGFFKAEFGEYAENGFIEFEMSW